MRIDARHLLDRLGRNDFAYKEFEDRFTELELWPMFEALLRDPRLQMLDAAEGMTPSAPKEEVTHVAPAEPFGALFNRYGRSGEDAESPPSERRGAQPQDVRAMLRHLSDLGSRGEI